MQFLAFKKRMVMNTKAATFCLSLVCVVSISVQASILTITNTNDNGPGSLRQALVNANVGDTIDATGINGVITLITGELLVNRSVTINGPGADLLAVDGNAAGVVFQVMSTGPVTISDLTIKNGHAGSGGGIFNGGVGTLTIINSALSGNTADFGGGVYNGGSLNIVNSTISGNTANTEGAGVYNPVTVTIINSTFSDNASKIAGGVFNTGTLVITNSTITNNTSMFLAGGVVNLNNFQIGNTILNEGPASANIYNNSSGVVMSRGYNLSSDDASGILTGPGDQIRTDPKLGPLRNNGGHTLTHALLPGSPAIDAGDPSFTPPPSFDQRGSGFDRVVDGRIDKGSFEAQTGGTPTATPTATPGFTPTPTVTPQATATPTPTLTVQVTVRTNPAGLAFTVDGDTHGSTQRFSWASGSTHTIGTTSPQKGGTGVRHVWMNWSDSGAISHAVAPTANKTYTATFKTQYHLTMTHGTGGTVSPISGWKNGGTAISISAMPASDFSFTNWTGSGTGSFSGTNNPASITMGGPITETATFTHN